MPKTIEEFTYIDRIFLFQFSFSMRSLIHQLSLVLLFISNSISFLLIIIYPMSLKVALIFELYFSLPMSIPLLKLSSVSKFKRFPYTITLWQHIHHFPFILTVSSEHKEISFAFLRRIIFKIALKGILLL